MTKPPALGKWRAFGSRKEKKRKRVLPFAFHWARRRPPMGEVEGPSRSVDVEFILVRDFFVLEELVLFGQEFLKRRSFLEANRLLISVRQRQQRALIVSAAYHQLVSRHEEAVFFLELPGEC